MSSTVQQKLRRPSMQIIEEVADEKGLATTELSPLYETIDVEALDALLQLDTDGDEGIRCIQFQYEGYTVAVDSEGSIVVVEDNH